MFEMSHVLPIISICLEAFISHVELKKTDDEEGDIVRKFVESRLLFVHQSYSCSSNLSQDSWICPYVGHLIRYCYIIVIFPLELVTYNTTLVLIV